MPILSIGKTDIPYRITHSDLAIRKRIIVTPNDVEVIVPALNDDAEVHDFIYKKRRWVYDKREAMSDWLSRFENNDYTKLQSGAKIAYRGRNMRISIKREKCDSVTVSYQNGFSIYIPMHIDENKVESVAGMALKFWLKDRVKVDVRFMAKYYSNMLGLKYQDVKIEALSHMWGSCTKGGVIKINWHLIAAPKSVLEYVVLHEICHLKHRNHSDEFWALVLKKMPQYRLAAKWLQTHSPEYQL
jgi:predicted metal-dependent hydrolase